MPQVTETTTYYPPTTETDKPEAVDHPTHYQSANDPDGTYEAIKVIFALGWGPEFCKANAFKYAARAGKKDDAKEAEDLRKAAWYLTYLADELEGKH